MLRAVVAALPTALFMKFAWKRLENIAAGISRGICDSVFLLEEATSLQTSSFYIF
jgi:hypothetical protein